MQSVSYFKLLSGNRNYRNLWFGQVISELGSWFSFIAEIGTVALMSDSPLATAALLVSRLLPVIVFAPLAGVWVDRLSRKNILIITDLIRAVIALGFLTSLIGAPLWFIILCSGLMSATGQFFDAAKNAAIPNMVARTELLTATVMIISVRFMLQIIGAAMGGAVAAGFGYKAAFIVNSLSFVASAIYIYLIPANVMREKSRNSVDNKSKKYFQDVLDGLSFIKSNVFVRAIILVNIGWGLGGGMSNLIYAEMSKRRYPIDFGSRDKNLAAMFIASGIGMVIGFIVAKRVGAWIKNELRASHYIGWTLIAHGLFFVLAGITRSLIMAAIFICISRIILAAEYGIQETLVMRVIPDDFRGRVFTVDRALDWGAMAFSMSIAGFLLTRFHPATMLIASGLLSAIPGIIWLLAMWKYNFRVPGIAVHEPHPVPSD